MIFRLMFGFETLNTGQSTPDAFPQNLTKWSQKRSKDAQRSFLSSPTQFDSKEFLFDVF